MNRYIVKTSSRKINKTNFVFFIFTPIGAILATVWLYAAGLVRWQDWVLAVGFMLLTGFSITAGYHRLFSHKSYKAAWIIKFLFVLFGSAAYEGSVLEWCTDHRNHHRYTDTDRDPYDIKKGFWFAHIGWIFTLDQSTRNFSNVEDLLADSLLRWQHRYNFSIAAVMGFILPTIVGGLWGSWLGGLIIAGALRVSVNQHLTFCINSVCHLFGKRTYSNTQSARDNWIVALFTYGEGYHNFHHQFPIDYRNGIRFYQFDPTKWLIKLLFYLKLTNDLNIVSEHRIIRYRFQNEEKLLLAKMAKLQSACSEHMYSVVTTVRVGINHVLKQIDRLEKEYLSLRKAKINEYRLEKQCRDRLNAANKELKQYMFLWTRLVGKGNHLSVPSAIEA